MQETGLIKRIFHFLFLFTRPMTLGVRIIVEDEAGRVLLVRHSYTPGWYLPGGGVEVGETTVEAAIKEVSEEAAIRVKGELELISVYYNRNASRRDHVVLYYSNDWEKAGEFSPNREIVEIGFFERDKLPEGVTKATLRRLEERYEGKKAAPYW